jgi:hypothetical protein
MNMMDVINPIKPPKNQNEPEGPPPEQSGGSDNLGQPDTEPQPYQDMTNQTGTINTPQTQNPNKRHFFWKRWNKRQRLTALIGGGIFLIIATFAGLSIFTTPPYPPLPAVIDEKVEPPKPTTAPSKLTGVEVALSLNELPVTGIMIENSPDARPQSGLKNAGVVFEAIAEGGITRFLALYQESKPTYIGPVRSVRPYYLDFLVPFDAAIAHAGGSAAALAQIRSQGIRDLDQFSNPSAYQRVSSRFAPHNLYTNREKLLSIHKSKGFNSSKFTSWERKEEEPPEAAKVNKITFDISSFLYNTSYVYDKKSNSYKRSMAGKPHIDERAKSQISPKVLIAMITTRGQDGIYSVYKTTGGGKVLVYQDGNVTEGKWSKKNRKGQLTFTQKDGTPLALNPGQTWIALITSGGVKHSP